MSILKNIVKIETLESIGTGVLLECGYYDTNYGEKYYIVLTNKHIFNGEEYIKENNTYCGIKLTMYNDINAEPIEMWDNDIDEQGYAIIDIFIHIY